MWKTRNKTLMSVTNANIFFSFENTINQLIITITFKIFLNILFEDFLTDDINFKDFLSFFFLTIFFQNNYKSYSKNDPLNTCFISSTEPHICKT